MRKWQFFFFELGGWLYFYAQHCIYKTGGVINQFRALYVYTSDLFPPLENLVGECGLEEA